ncbi:hypothetical protein DL240_05065 [Lujinxingia litoralis]|uniref:Lipoprotein n=1 Tax=Lujinxingia litoralis TaxID=2211119 RepID=A0A328C6R7_9DELT|nr:hypothetical protein [Lujinxingia litoralis]RAL23533.1 hypothetical protein DL240_05065 [Lujinxingia litoralis]
MMKRTLIALIALGLVACGQSGEDGGPGDGLTSQGHQSVRVTPEFRLSGIGELPEELIIEEVGLAITEIRLQPVVGSEVAYSTTRPFGLSFDLSRGESAIQGMPVEFPQSGRYLVSVRMEPLSEGERAELDPMDAADVPEGSLELNGLVRYGAVADGKVGGNDEDGNPLPLPFERTRVEIVDTDTGWTPFHYESNRAVFFALSNVELSPGDQTLVFTFDLNQWAIRALEPIVEAVESVGRQGQAGEVIHISPSLDSGTDGAEVLARTATVAALPQGY